MLAWRFGYGNRFDEHALKSLPIGSVYSEPGHANHFAQPGAEPVLVEISAMVPPIRSTSPLRIRQNREPRDAPRQAFADCA
jgi:hypothetical protein